MPARRRGSRALTAVGCAVALACGTSPRPAGVIVYASGADLESGNPLVTIHPLSRQVQRFALFTTLARYDSLLAPEPYAARWMWSPDRRTLTFHLVADLRWHDGHPTTARDVAFTLLAARDPVTGYPRAGDLATLDTVLALDDTTAVLRFGIPPPTFPLVLCELPVLPMHLLDSVPRAAMRRASFNLAPVGNGPYRFVERAPGRYWRFARNDAFPVALGGPPLMEGLVIVVVDEPTTKFAGLASGELDVAGISAAMVRLADRDPTIRVMDYPVLFSTALVLNVHRPPFDDVRVRRAVDLALDRTRIVQAALAGFGLPAAGPVPPESPLTLGREPVRDVSMSDSLLDAAGWLRGNDGIRTRGGRPFAVELLTVGSGDLAIEQLVQADLAERGMTITIRSFEMGAFLAAARASPKAFDLLLTGIPGDLSLSYLAAMYDSRQRGGALDYADAHSARLDVLFARTREAGGPDLVAAWRAVQEELMTTVPAVWIYHARGVQGVAARLRGVRMDLRGELVTVTAWHTGDGPR